MVFTPKGSREAQLISSQKQSVTLTAIQVDAK
jgi:hypothetical protein